MSKQANTQVTSTAARITPRQFWDARPTCVRRTYTAQLEQAEDTLGRLALELDNASADDYDDALAAYNTQLATVTGLRASHDNYDA